MQMVKRTGLRREAKLSVMLYMFISSPNSHDDQMYQVQEMGGRGDAARCMSQQGLTLGASRSLQGSFRSCCFPNRESRILDGRTATRTCLVK